MIVNTKGSHLGQVVLQHGGKGNAIHLGIVICGIWGPWYLCPKASGSAVLKSSPCWLYSGWRTVGGLIPERRCPQSGIATPIVERRIDSSPAVSHSFTVRCGELYDSRLESSFGNYPTSPKAATTTMNLITREELKEKLDRGDDFKLVCALSEWAYRAKHIPGSLHIDNPKKATEFLEKSDEIVVYCSDVHCPASKYAYHILTSSGYENGRRYAGGIIDWEDAGYPVEGEWAEAGAEAEATR